MVFSEHYFEVLDVFSELFIFIFDGLNARFRREIETVRAQHPFEDLAYTRPSLRLTYAEGVAMLRESLQQFTAAEITPRAAEIDRSACVLVVVDPASRERRVPDDCTPLAGDPATVAAAMHAYAAAGADEVILVANPIDHESIRVLGRALALLDD
jgi:alkanesulfonate monooxygenase SsuD/methylene tetrahydromethanopterin reductase-like flavin-dependent oxidoreductase (luciferase family)